MPVSSQDFVFANSFVPAFPPREIVQKNQRVAAISRTSPRETEIAGQGWFVVTENNYSSNRKKRNKKYQEEKAEEYR